MSIKADHYAARQAVINQVIMESLESFVFIADTKVIRDKMRVVFTKAREDLLNVDAHYRPLAEDLRPRSTENMGRPERLIYLFEYSDAEPTTMTYEAAAIFARKRESTFRVKLSTAGGSMVLWINNRHYVVSRENSKEAVDRALKAKFLKTHNPDDLFELKKKPLLPKSVAPVETPAPKLPDNKVLVELPKPESKTKSRKAAL